MIVIGSQAAKYWFSDFRDPKDWDIVTKMDELLEWYKNHSNNIKSFVPNKLGNKFLCRLQDNTSIEFEISDFIPSDKELTSFINDNNTIDGFGVKLHVPDPTILLLLKKSTLYWPVHWMKNIQDYHWLKNRISSTIEDSYQRFFELRLEESKSKFGHHKAFLNQSNEEFFGKSKVVGRIIDHDQLHELVKKDSRPAHELARPDLSSPLMNRAMFEKLNHTQQLNCVIEEAIVIALERKLLKDKMVDAQQAYEWALQRICTNLTSGWFRDFAIETWPETKALSYQDLDLILELRQSVGSIEPSS